MNSVLSKGSWVHFVAIGGTGMGALAGLLQDFGCTVTGVDGPLYPPMSLFLEQRKIPLSQAYSADNLKGASWGLAKQYPDLVIVGNAISRGNVEAKELEDLLARGISKRMSFAQALAEFGIADRRSFVVAGTHGKTTTTSLLAWSLEVAGRSPGFFIGGIAKNFEQGCRVGQGSVFVSEGDEYDTAYWDKESKFLHYRPSWVLCTGIEFDHADIFSSVEAIEASFEKLVSKTREGWLLIDSLSAPRPESVEKIAMALQGPKLKLLRYGFDPGSDYSILESAPSKIPGGNSLGTKIRLRTPELGIVELLSPMCGRHNALNVAGVVGVLLSSGEIKSLAPLQDFLLKFLGIKRRQEEVVRAPGLIVIDDFAHHPTAIRETLAAICERYPGFKIAAFFESRSATSARKILAQEFSESFDLASAVFLIPPTKTNIPEAEKLDVKALVEAISRRKANENKFITLEANPALLAEIFKKWRSSLPAGETTVALVMSNGPFGGIHFMLA